MARSRGKSAGTVHFRGNVDAGVAVEEVGGLQLEADVLDGHDGEVLDAGGVRNAEAVPDDGVVAGNRAILRHTGDSVQLLF